MKKYIQSFLVFSILTTFVESSYPVDNTDYCLLAKKTGDLLVKRFIHRLKGDDEKLSAVAKELDALIETKEFKKLHEEQARAGNIMAKWKWTKKQERARLKEIGSMSFLEPNIESQFNIIKSWRGPNKEEFAKLMKNIDFFMRQLYYENLAKIRKAEIVKKYKLNNQQSAGLSDFVIGDIFEEYGNIGYIAKLLRFPR